MEGIKGKNAPNYRDIVGKSSVHRWLDINYGRPRICESKTCDGKTDKRWFDWAKVTGKEYERKRENFLRLCRSCHRRYDMTPEKKKQAEGNLWWKTGVKVNFAYGERAPKVKLTSKQVEEIRDSKIRPYKKLGEMYGITKDNVGLIMRRKTWKNL